MKRTQGHLSLNPLEGQLGLVDVLIGPSSNTPGHAGAASRFYQPAGSELRRDLGAGGRDAVPSARRWFLKPWAG